MKKNMIIILIVSIILMIAVVMFVGYYHVSSTAKIPISAKIMVNDCSENIMCWQNENGDYYIFLPSYAELSQVSLSKETSSEIFLDESPIVDGMTCETLKLDYPYVLTYMYYGREVVKTLTIVRSGNVPTMYIDTFSELKKYIQDSDKEKLLSFFQEAKDYRDSLTIPAKKHKDDYYEIFIDLKDETGGIAIIANILAFKGISIKNIGIINNREFEEGVLRIELYDLDSLNTAVTVLEERNYIVYRR